MKEEILKILENKYLLPLIISILLMELLVILGNPHSGLFYYHFIPEMFATFFLGALYGSMMGPKAKIIAWFSFLSGSILTPFLVAGTMIQTLPIVGWVIVFSTCFAIGLPLLFGFYWASSPNEKELRKT